MARKAPPVKWNRMFLRLRLLVTGALTLWLALFLFSLGGRLLALTSAPAADAHGAGPSVSRKVLAHPAAKTTARKRAPAVAPTDEARWQP
jgi:hypothetical protein